MPVVAGCAMHRHQQLAAADWLPSSATGLSGTPPMLTLMPDCDIKFAVSFT
eukprot:COSAG02_NODE_37443_length_442_cov_0.562682_2_plen_50_part_01